MRITKPTWIIHAICPCADDPNPVSTHVVFETIGLKQYGLLELELNLPLSPERGKEILNYIAFHIVNKDIEAGHNIINKELFTAPFSFIETRPIHFTDPSEKILRVIIADHNNNFPWDQECEEIFKNQI